MPQAIRDGVIVVLVISGPLVLAAAFIGLVIGVLQAATQVQEQTIGSALKIIGVFALIIFAGFWMYQYLNNYTSRTLSTAFTFIPRQTQKAVPAHTIKEEEFKESFEKEKVDIEAAQKPIRLIPQEKLETKLPRGGPPPGIPYLGAPESTKPPEVSKLTPPTIPEVPPLPKIGIPLADFQEPKTISVPTTPSVQNNAQTPQDVNIPANTETIEQGEDTNTLINIVPDDPAQIDNKGETDLWLRKELFSKNTNNENFNESQAESTETNEKPSWLN